MKRREFIALMGGVASWPLPSDAQQPSVIGFLGPGSAQSDAYRVKAFRQGLAETGFVESQNLTIEYRWAEGHYDRLPLLATDLVNRQVAVIAASSCRRRLQRSPQPRPYQLFLKQPPIQSKLDLSPVSIALVVMSPV